MSWSVTRKALEMTVTGNTKSTGDTSRPVGQRVAEQVSERTDIHVTLPGLGRINLGPPDQLAYFAGIATLHRAGNDRMARRRHPRRRTPAR